MVWEEYERQYLLARRTAQKVTELREVEEVLAPQVAAAFSQLTAEDEQWFADALVDSERKWFVLFVLYESLLVPKFLFEPLLRAAIYEVDPSYNGRFIKPALVAFGWRRVNQHLLETLERGSDFEKAGAVNAFYWSTIPYVHWGGDEVKTTEDLTDLRIRKRQMLLKEFVQNPDVQVRRSIIPSLNLDPADYPEELAALIPKAIEIAQTHPDEYIRHRLQIQLGQEGVLKPLPHRPQK